jgi:four helix bundle protein
VKDYREILIWQRGHSFTLEVYRFTSRFPKEEMFGLTSQMRRAAASIPANIAEGCGRDGDAELKRFMGISLGSACELDYFIQLAGDLGYIARNEVSTLSAEILEIRRMLGGFIQKLKA